MTMQELDKRRTTGDTPERLNNETWYTPAADILEDNDGYTLFFDMPGVQPDAIDITFDDGVLNIEGKISKTENVDSRNYLVREYGIGHFSRSFTIRTPVDPDAIKGDLKNGELQIRIPKAQSAKTKKITVQGG
ncbi:MAG: Hsp20/alpha crystallin family protein [Phycisphaerae bacterium]